MGRRYAKFSERRPYVSSVGTAFTVLSVADVSCQTLTRREGEPHDWARTYALSFWGTMHYGFCQKFFYLTLDKMLGPGNAIVKTILDVYIWTPCYLIPSYYFVTGKLKSSKSFSEIWEQLQSEWCEASFGSAAFWTPIIFCNFKFVPQHSRLLLVVAFSFLFNGWLSYLSNRDAVAARREADDVQPRRSSEHAQAPTIAVEGDIEVALSAVKGDAQGRRSSERAQRSAIADAVGARRDAEVALTLLLSE